MTGGELVLAGACALGLFLLGMLVVDRARARSARSGIEREQALQRRWALERERQAAHERERDAVRLRRLRVRLVAAVDQRVRLLRVLNTRRRALERDDDSSRE